MKDILGDYEGFIRTLTEGLKARGIARDEISMMDHICYRVETLERYQALLPVLSADARLLGENEVNGRMIATFELNDYLQVDSWTIPYLELPAPKEGSPFSEGLEHAELVVIGSLERFIDRHSDLPFSLKGMDKTINPEAGLKDGVFSVKFHEQQLGAVVRIENKVGMSS
ncbi:MAG: putative dihydroxybiphenyl dioxygenase [Candidatus Saccharibacteria bacterium]|nr:putative dihydroxybiphenyl dioxygenase [Candidatus Saccharibacteria bacterium]